MTSVVYIATHPTGVFYIGSTTDFPKRKAAHLYHLRANNHYSTLLQEAFNKSPELVWEQIEVSDDNRLLKEAELLEIHRNSPQLANVRFGTTPGALSAVRSTEFRTKVSEANSGLIRTDETKQLMSSQRKGVSKSPEWSDKIADATRIKVEVDGITYKSATEVSRQFGCTVMTVMNRCRNDKFPGWKIIP